MITTQLPNTTPYSITDGLASRLTAITLKNRKAEQVNDTCSCDLNICDYTETVFGTDDPALDNDFWRNDKSTFLDQKILGADSVLFQIFKDGVKLADIIDDTYGALYASGFFTAQPLYVGLEIDWGVVFRLNGAGVYQIKKELSIVGVATTEESQLFRLLEYSDRRASGSVRLEWFQTGNILSNDLDYTDLLPDGWYRSYRINGRLRSPEFEKTVDKYFDTNYTNLQILESIGRVWEVQTNLIPVIISDLLNMDASLANTFQVTDYNLQNNAVYRRQDLYLTDIEKNIEPEQTPLRMFKYTFSDKVENILKHNV